jgi:hypothetical protein
MVDAGDITEYTLPEGLVYGTTALHRMSIYTNEAFASWDLNG